MCTRMDCLDTGNSVLIKCKGCSHSLHSKCALGTERSRCKACHNIKHMVLCSYPKCSARERIREHVCATNACDAVYHHMCLTASGYPTEFSEAEPPHGLCYKCVTNAVELVRIDKSKEVVPESPQQGQGTDQVTSFDNAPTDPPQPLVMEKLGPPVPTAPVPPKPASPGESHPSILSCVCV